MFDFDNDGDFDLQDLVEADIQYGLFEEDEKFINSPQKARNKKVSPLEKAPKDLTKEDKIAIWVTLFIIFAIILACS